MEHNSGIYQELHERLFGKSTIIGPTGPISLGALALGKILRRRIYDRF